jgi:hypothetical protein
LAVALTVFCVLLLPETANAQAQLQQNSAQPEPAAAGRAEQTEQTEKAEPQTFSVTVKVEHGTDGADDAAAGMSGKAVILRAARPKGPFEPTDPKPKHEWSAVTDASGVATFEGLPMSVATSGLRLHAVATHGGWTFKSAQIEPEPGIELKVKVYEQGHDLSGVVIKELQSIAHIWEDHVFFQQFYLLTVEGDKVVDTSQLPGREFDNGLPIRLPTMALGIHIQAPGETKVVNNFAYWKGLLKSGETVPVSITFSMRASDTDFVYEQTVDYPVESAKVVVPLESTSPQIQIPYFGTVALAAPGFDVQATEGGIGGQNTGMFLVADGRSLEAGESFAFQLTGLPFDQPVGGWLALALGLAGVIFVLGYARREQRHIDDSRRSGELAEMLRREREELLDELAILEQDFEDGEVGDLEYERESLLLRERIALVMKKIGELGDAGAEDDSEDNAA